MKFIDMNGVGGSEVLYISETAKPKMDAEHLLVKVLAIGVNRADILQRQGKYPPPKGESEILGLEVCGEVVEARDTSWVGKKVFGLVAGGAYGQYCLLKPQHAFELPGNFSMVEGAAIAEVFLTAFQALFAIGKLSASQTVLIHAGASGVGCAAIQLAKAAQARVVVTCGSDEKVQFCQALGADLAINYRHSDFVSLVKSDCKNHGAIGVDVVLDCVAGDYINKDINCLNMDGKIVVIAMMGGRFVGSLDMAKMLAKRVSFVASTLRNRSDSYKTQLIADFKRQFWPLLCQGGDGELKAVIDSVFDWQDVAKAHDHIESNRNQGKVVLTVS